jgi:hydrogenase 3 maturation protease
MVNILMGVGSSLRGDDAIGSWVANHLKHRLWLSIDCGTVPENFISVVEKRKPKYLVIVDAAELGLEAGEFRIIPKDKIDSVGIGTHTLPLSLLISEFEKYCENVICIGVEPKATEPFSKLSKEAKRAGEKIIVILKTEKFGSLAFL